MGVPFFYVFYVFYVFLRLKSTIGLLMMITFCLALLIITFILCLSPRHSRSLILTLAGRRQEGRAHRKVGVVTAL